MFTRVSSVSCVLIACLLSATTVVAGMPGSDVYVSSVGRGPGALGSYWYTTAWIHNPGSEAVTFTISLLVRDQANPSPDQVSLSVDAGETLKLGDVLFDVFGEDEAVGALRFESEEPVVVASRIYNLPGTDLADSQGQFFGGMPAELSVSVGEYTDVPGITQPADDSFRCNFGLVETAGGVVEVHVTLHNHLGIEMATRIYALGPYEPMQTNVSALLSGVAVDGGRLHFDVVSGTGSVLAFASMVGNGTVSQDPSTLEMEYEAVGQSGDGDITGVIAGAGLSGGGEAGQVTLDVNAGGGIGISGDTVILADGGVTKSKLSATGGTSGQVLGTDGANLLWQDSGDGDMTNVISFPARSLSYHPESTIITDSSFGLTWKSDYSNASYLMLKKPSDYTSGDVTYSVFFQTRSATAGTVDFFLRPTSYSSGDGVSDPGSVSSTGAVAVSGTIGFGTLYELTIVIPSTRMTEDWWFIWMQRNSTNETYTEDVVVTSISLTYNTN